jgi:hypothetical protein
MGVTGQAIVRAIVAGERDPVVLAKYRNPACKSSEETIAKALSGTWKDELLFVLEQALALYDAYTARIEVCDTHIVQTLGALESRGIERDNGQQKRPDLARLTGGRLERDVRAQSFTCCLLIV